MTVINAVIGYLQESKAEGAIARTLILILGIVTAIALQVVFSQWSVMNTLFETAPLTWNQWLICLIPMLPMVPLAIFANAIDPQ